MILRNPEKGMTAMRLRTCVIGLFAASLLCPLALADPLAETYLLEGKLAEGEKASIEHLAKNPKDDQARFGLAAIQLLLSFEHLGTSLYEHGLRSERAFPGMTREFRELLPQNPEPKELAYDDVRRMLQTFLADLAKTDATLAKISDPNVKLPLHVGLIKVDLFGLDKPVNAAFVLGQIEADLPEDPVKSFVIGFDRGDVEWLRGYSHFLSAWGEALLAVDGQEIFDCTAHLFFEKVATPHKFLVEEDRNFERIGLGDRPAISDVIAFIHLLRFPMKEPERMQASLAHLDAMLDHSRAMWKHYKAEMDDDHEWIPNVRQTGVMQVKVTEEMISTWLTTVDEADQVLAGKKLIPFWRGKGDKRGVNLRRVFTEPRTIDPILWVQGTAATPYLEEGPLTDFANPRMFTRINDNFGGINFIGFAFWFN
jgi:hypothetical protein